MYNEVYFHEDDYCQIELLPSTSWKFCFNQIKEIDEFSEKHKVKNGIGWDKIYIRKESPYKIESLIIKFDDYMANPHKLTLS